MDIFVEHYEDIVNGRSITCTVTGHEIKPVMPPRVILMDVRRFPPSSMCED